MINFLKCLIEISKVWQIKQLNTSLNKIKNPIYETVKIAVKHYGWNIAHVKNSCLELQLLAVKYNVHTIMWIENPYDEVQRYALDNGPAYIIGEFKNPSESIQFYYLNKNPQGVVYFSNLTKNVQKWFIQKYPHLMNKIRNPCPEIQLLLKLQS